jgi:hypothetical protein
MARDYVFEPRELQWRETDASQKSLTIRNTGTEDILIEVAGPVSTGNDDFVWAPQGRTALPKASSAHSTVFYLPVRPPIPRTGLGLRTAAIHVQVFDMYGNFIENHPVPCSNDATAKIVYGDIVITNLVFDPLGPDLPGEYVELTNMTDRTLDLTDSYLSQIKFGQHDIPTESRFPPFTADVTRSDFGKTCLLPPHAALRVMSRAQGNDGPNSAIYYLGQNAPVWNNAGDRATLYNNLDQLVATYGYETQSDRPAPGPVPQRVLVRFTVEIAGTTDWQDIFTVEDGDLVDIVTDDAAIEQRFVNDDVIAPGTITVRFLSFSYLPSGRPLLILPRRAGDAEIAPFNENYQLAGAAKYSLLCRVGLSATPIAVGAGLAERLRVIADQPTELYLGINDQDGQFGNNTGSFIAHVTIWR